MRRVALLVALAALLIGCADDGPQALLDRAPDALERAGTARFTMTVSSTGAVRDAFSADGAQDLRTGALRMSVHTGEGEPEAETLLVDNQLYVRSELSALFGLEAGTWVRFDLEAAAADSGLATSEELLSSNAGPVALLQQLRGAAEDVQSLGRDEVRGVTTTRLQVTVVTARAIDQAPAEVREQLRAYAEATGLPDRYPLEVWIDRDALPRRIRTVLDATDGGRTVTQQVELELFDYGAPVDLDAPPPDRVVELQQLIDQLAERERAEVEGTP